MTSSQPIARAAEVSSLAAIAMLVAHGLGVSIAPDATTDWWPHWPVVRLPLPQPTEARRFGMVWLRTSLRARAIETLAEHARIAVRTLEPAEAVGAQTTR